MWPWLWLYVAAVVAAGGMAAWLWRCGHGSDPIEHLLVDLAPPCSLDILPHQHAIEPANDGCCHGRGPGRGPGRGRGSDDLGSSAASLMAKRFAEP